MKKIERMDYPELVNYLAELVSLKEIDEDTVNTIEDEYKNIPDDSIVLIDYRIEQSKAFTRIHTIEILIKKVKISLVSRFNIELILK